jgi:hypothetical protein
MSNQILAEQLIPVAVIIRTKIMQEIFFIPKYSKRDLAIFHQNTIEVLAIINLMNYLFFHLQIPHTLYV